MSKAYEADDDQDAFADEEFDGEDLDEQMQRIAAILGQDDLDVTQKTVNRYFDYLKQHVQLPCRLTGIEDFPWEERYVFGYGDEKEYERLKKTQPSYTDTFELMSFAEAQANDGILVEVRRVSDQKKFTLPLADLEAADEGSPNYQLLDDYSVWFVNYR
jgi:hypothetical protein